MSYSEGGGPACADIPKHAENLKGVGMGVPGALDPAGGHVVYQGLNLAGHVVARGGKAAQDGRAALQRDFIAGEAVEVGGP